MPSLDARRRAAVLVGWPISTGQFVVERDRYVDG
jgi:hypothetical protein